MTRIVGTRESRRRSRFLVSVPFALFAVVALAISLSGSAIATTADCTNTATLTGSAFEIDTSANLKVDTSGCIDWLAGGTGTAFRTGVLAKNDSPSGSGDESFGKGTAEDNPNPTVVTGSIPPNKSDLKAFGVFTEDDFLELFWSRVQNPSGTTNMDFELNKEFCDGTAAHCANNGSASDPVYITPKRTSGDRLITYDLSKGGTVPSISIRTWTGSAWGPATVISGGSDPDARGSVNTSTIPTNESGGATGGLTTALGQQDPFTFGEAAISFEALFGEGACGSFGSVYLKSRSSDSFTSEIKDFVPPEAVQLSNCQSGLTTTAVTPVTVGQPISDTAHLDVPDGAGGTITFHLWTTNTNGTCSGEVNTGLTPVNVDGPGDYPSGDYTTTTVGTFYWTAVYSGAAGVDGDSTACGEAGETSVVNPIQSGISTTQSVIPNDSATITGGGTGNVRFRLYAGTSCSTSATAIVDQSRPIGSGGIAATNNTTIAVSTSQTYSWLVEYAGDGTHTGATSSCSTEHFAVTFTNG
jgi:hypothetical protein